MLYHKTKNLLYVQQQLVNFEPDEWMSAVAKTVEEACRLVDAGFEYVSDFEGAKIFRKRK